VVCPCGDTKVVSATPHVCDVGDDVIVFLFFFVFDCGSLLAYWCVGVCVCVCVCLCVCMCVSASCAYVGLVHDLFSTKYTPTTDVDFALYDYKDKDMNVQLQIWVLLHFFLCAFVLQCSGVLAFPDLAHVWFFVFYSGLCMLCCVCVCVCICVCVCVCVCLVCSGYERA
jgi:hypothetical protein